MGSKKYPLSALVDVRRDQADAATRELGDRIRAREATAKELEAARQRTLAHAAQMHDEKAAERAALDTGALRAVDLMRQDAWQMQRDREAAELAQRELHTAEALRAATTEETEARTATAEKLGELKAVERDRERFVEHEKKAQLAKEEEAAEEAWRPR